MLAETHKFILDKSLKISKGNFKEYKKDIEKVSAEDFMSGKIKMTMN